MVALVDVVGYDKELVAVFGWAYDDPVPQVARYPVTLRLDPEVGPIRVDLNGFIITADIGQSVHMVRPFVSRVRIERRTERPGLSPLVVWCDL